MRRPAAQMSKKQLDDANEEATPRSAIQPHATTGFDKLYQSQGGPEGKGNIIPVTTTDEAVAAMQSAVDQGTFSVVGGGHGYEGHGTSKHSIISLSSMAQIKTVTGVNAGLVGKEYVAIEGGAKLAALYEFLFMRYNTFIPGGSCWAVGAGGHITGGGYGIYSRTHGLTVDYVAGVEFAWVNSKKKVQRVMAWNNSPELELRKLLWACRGAMAGNFGVILTYYLDLEQLKHVCTLDSPTKYQPSTPAVYYQIALTIMPNTSECCTPKVYRRLFRANYDWWRDRRNAGLVQAAGAPGGSMPNTGLTFFRANQTGIALVLYFFDRTALLAYLKTMFDALHDAPGCGAAALKQVQLHHTSKGHGGQFSEASRSVILAADNSDADEGRAAMLEVIENQLLAYSFWEFTEANSTMGQNCYFKNSGHVIGTPRSKDVPTTTHGKDLFDLGYTKEQLHTIFEHVLQMYMWVDPTSIDYDDIVKIPVYSGEYRVASEYARLASSLADAEAGDSGTEQKFVYLKKVPQSTTGARPQWAWISQHGSQHTNRHGKFAPGAKPTKPLPPLGDTANSKVHFVWQHDPFNGKPQDFSKNAANPVPMGPSADGTPWALPATSVSNRDAVLKVQPQLYWDFAEDSEYMLKWFDNFTGKVFSSVLSEDKPEGYKMEFPRSQGLYINYPDSYYMKMYPADNKELAEIERWPFLLYGDNKAGADGRSAATANGCFLKTLMEVKGMFDSTRNFDLASRKYDQTEQQATPALSIPFPTGKVTPYDAPPRAQLKRPRE